MAAPKLRASYDLHIETVINFQNVAKHFGATPALDGVSFRVERGETIALLGPNGAGKSTAVSILLGLRRPDSGAVQVLGGTPRDAVAQGSVGALLQSAGLPQGVKVREVVQLARQLSPHPAPLTELLKKTGLESIAERRVDGLSGGQAQRVRYSLAIAGNPEVLFLDEPTVGMDVETQRDFWRDMHEHANAGRTILFATHYLHEAESVADRVVVLRAGRLVADGSPATIKAASGRKSVRFTLPDAEADAAMLGTLAGVEEVERHGETVVLATKDADATVVALVRSGVAFRNIEVGGADLEDAFLALTEEG